jgi:hypothetical protein
VALIEWSPGPWAKRWLERRKGYDFRGWREKLWGWLLFDAGDFVMMRKMLLGIKERAEHLHAV